MNITRGVRPYGLQIYYSCREIDNICEDALRKSSLLPEKPEPIRIDRFVEKHFQCQVQYEDLGSNHLGCTAFRKDGSVERIVISSTLAEDGKDSSLRRERSTFAHEAGHGLLHAQLFIDDEQSLFDRHNCEVKERKIMCRDGDIRPARRQYDGKWWEWQANRAIGALLLPRPLVLEAIKPLIGSEAGISGLAGMFRDKAVGTLSEIFDVNPAVVRIRLDEITPEQKDSLF